MNELFSLHSAAEGLLWFHLKGMVLLTISALLARLSGSGSAAFRHLVLVSGAASILLLGLVSPFQFLELPVALSESSVGELLAGGWKAGGSSLGGDGMVLAGGPLQTVAKTDVDAAGSFSSRIDSAPTIPALQSIPGGNRNRFAFGFLGIWGLGVLLGVVRVLAGEFWLREILRRATAVNEVELLDWVRQLASGLGIDRRRIRLLTSDSVASPFTRGSLHPILVLPSCYVDWPRERLERILVHEIAHIARFDHLSLRAAQCAVTLQWLNPLGFLVLRRIRRLQELACDDQVLSARLSARGLAEDLLWLARKGGGLAWQIGALGGSSALEGRLKSLLDTTANHRPAGGGLAGIAFTTAGALALLVGGSGFSEGVAASPSQAGPGWATILDQGRILFRTEATIEVEGAGTLRASSRNRILDFADPVQVFVDGRTVEPGYHLLPAQQVEIRGSRGNNSWRIRLASDPENRPRGRSVGSARGRNVSFVFEPGEASFYHLRFERDRVDIQGWLLGGTELGVRFDRTGPDSDRLQVRAILIDGPADQAGLRIGDIVTAIEGKPATLAVLHRVLARRSPGSNVRFQIQRDGGSRMFVLHSVPSRDDPSAGSWRGPKYKSD